MVMFSTPLLPALGFLAYLVVGVVSQPQWCGKNYMASQPIVPPGGQFSIPTPSKEPLLSFRCVPVIKPYIFPEDVSKPAGILIDTPVIHSRISGAAPIGIPDRGPLGALLVTVRLDGRVLAQGSVPLNTSGFELPFQLEGIQPRREPFNLTCTASYRVPTSVGDGQGGDEGDVGEGGGGHTQTFEAFSALSYLPAPPEGRSVTKMDLRTGALLARPVGGQLGEYETVFPIGFYTNFGGYLASNLSLLDEIKADGFTIVHPIPTFDNLTALELVLDRMQELGLWLMYDMRWTYMNLTEVSAEVEQIRNRPNLLLWYTADEPDGWGDPLNGTADVYDLIYSLDGYHPVSLVLNCQNYYFETYTAGTDIVMQDTYMIGNNVTFSNQWGTPCTTDYGDCGCDNCQGEFEDISNRMDEFADRLFDLGWDRTKAVWTVPQAFGDDTYWTRKPTGKEWVVQSLLGVTHGSLGIVPWNDPTTPDIKASASALAKAMSTTLKGFILDPNATFQLIIQNRVHVGVWTVSGRTLVLATNLNYNETRFSLESVHASGSRISQVFDSGAKIQGKDVILESVGSGGFVLG